MAADPQSRRPLLGCPTLRTADTQRVSRPQYPKTHSLCGWIGSGSHLEQVWEGAGKPRHPKPQALEVQPQEAQELVGQEGVVEELGGEPAEHQLPHAFTVHCGKLT